MRSWSNWLGGAVILAVGGLALFSWGWAQEPSGQSANAPPQFPIKTLSPAQPLVLAKLSPLQQQFYLAAKAGKEWLLRLNRPDGRFLYGLEPSLRVPLKEDNYLHQAAAAFALARSAKFFTEQGAATVARQAVLTLLLETEKDIKNAQVRCPIAPGTNPLAAASWLILAISEFPDPGADLRQASLELCLYLRGQQQKDGALAPPQSPTEPKASEADRTAWAAPGLAMYALMRSMQHGQEPWKLEVVRKSRDFYQAQWRADKKLERIPWHTAACAEAYLLTKEQTFVQCHNEMNDWLCTLQYKEVQSQRLAWNGGFKKWEQGEVRAEPPDVHSAVFMEGLAQGCRLAKECGDLPRFQLYRQTLEQCGQFLLSLQYTEANSQHFEAKYRQDFLLGSFHASHQSGLLRLDFTQEAVCGLVKYMTEAAELK